MLNNKSTRQAKIYKEPNYEKQNNTYITVLMLLLASCAKTPEAEPEELQYGEIALESDSAQDAFREYMEKYLAQYGDLSNRNEYKTDVW